MNSFICLLRGINVGGANKIKMAELRTLLTSNGFSEVITYIQSGNILFKSDIIKTYEVSKKVRAIINNHYGYAINVMTLTLAELDDLTSHNPFLEDESDFAKLLVTIFRELPLENGKNEILKYVENLDDHVYFYNRFMFLHCPTGYGKTKLTSSFIERRLQTSGTTRNWKTMSKIVELSQTYR